MTDLEEMRRGSAAIFGNEKTVEVVLALSEEGAATAQMIATSTGIPHSLVRDAMVRLVNGGVVRQVPRVGGSRTTGSAGPSGVVAARQVGGGRD